MKLSLCIAWAIVGVTVSMVILAASAMLARRQKRQEQNEEKPLKRKDSE